MHLHSYLRSAEEIISLYDGNVPFAAWLKNYFKQHRKFGSRDRKIIADLCFCYFRTGGTSRGTVVEEQLLIAQFLCHGENEFIQKLRPELLANANDSLEEKVKMLGVNSDALFPFLSEVSHEIDTNKFALSHLIQPDLFLRIRPNKKEIVIKKLQDATIPFNLEGDCVRLANNTKIDEIIELDKEAVVQDKSSQQVLDSLQPQTNNYKPPTFISWDCCAASGGKTILLHDLFSKAQLTVSDIRESILHNLRNRFKRAGIQQYQCFVADVSSDQFRSTKKYDVVICDAPCSGSGTWGRTPEQLIFFQKGKIDHYANLQTRIVVNASKSVKEGGAFIYITCSVFRKENEKVVEHILQNTALKMQEQRYIKGYNEKADTLFAALFRL
jgi:16S rRNA (cytosine967-C5)-methyltransferase